MGYKVKWKITDEIGIVTCSLYETNLGCYQEVTFESGKCKFIHVSELEVLKDKNGMYIRK